MHHASCIMHHVSRNTHHDMSRKELESKIAKYLRKANRLKSIQAKLEHINELIDIVQGALSHTSIADGSSSPDSIQRDTDREYLENYLELCYMHKMKFQMDAMFSGIQDDIKRLNQGREQMSQEMFDGLMQRLQTVLEIDAEHPEAQELFQILRNKYNQYAQNLESPGLHFNIAQYKLPKLCIEIVCNLQDVEAHNYLKSNYKQYQVAKKNAEAPTVPDNGSLCRMQFHVEHLKDFEIFHEELRVKPSYKITVNNCALDEQTFSDWFQCYKRFLKAHTPQYCYGASPFTFNFFGCHKLSIKDVAKQLEKCWFYCGTLEQESGLFLITKKRIAEQVRTHLDHCGFCPALTQKKLVLGMALLPSYVNPECDSRWSYYHTQEGRTTVIPVGNDLAISVASPPGKGRKGAPPKESKAKGALNGSKKVSLNGGNGASSTEQPLTLIEVGSTPYIHKVLHYLESNNSSYLAEPAYRGLSTCMNCGGPYKPYTMSCSRCKLDFWKYAMKDVGGVLDRLRYFKEIKPQIWDIETRDSRIEVQSPISKVSEDTVSFDKLWDDPQVQELLASEQPIFREQETESKEKLSFKSRPLGPESRTADRFELHEKLRSLISKKYRERKAIEKAFSEQSDTPGASKSAKQKYQQYLKETSEDVSSLRSQEELETSVPKAQPPSAPHHPDKAALINAIKSLKPRQKSELSKRGVVRVIYHATMDKETCPLCDYLDGMVMDPDDPATDIFSPPLYPGCTCSREYVLKTEKPKNWPRVTFKFPPTELLIYLDKETKS